MLVVPPTAKADCSHALNACNLYVKALEEDGQLLHKKIDLQASTINKLTTELRKAEQPPAIPTWLIVALAGCAGAALGLSISK